MNNDEKTKGPYILWINNGYDGWSAGSYNSLKEAIEAHKYGSEYIITKKVEYEVKEKE